MGLFAVRAGIIKDGNGCRITIAAVPKASKSEVAGEYGDAIRIRIKAPPTDGKANKELISFLAKTLRVPASAITLAAGASGRRKSVVVSGLTPEKCEEILFC